MSGNGYKALGFVVWKGGIWYLRRRYGAAQARSAPARSPRPPSRRRARSCLAQRRNGYRH